MRSPSRSRSRSPHRSSKRRSRSPRRRSPERRRRSRTRSRSKSPSQLTSEPVIIDSWKMVRADQSNFDAWMHLLNLVDQYNDIPVARNVYDRFLEKYPFCYGFWKKYAEMERRNNNLTDCIKIWERAVTEIPLCCDLWIGLLGFMKEVAHVAPVAEDGFFSKSPSQLTSEPVIIDSWKMVLTEFNAWMPLLNLVDQYNDMAMARNVYDQFLKKYPFCYGFWKKYAEMERRNNNLTDCIKIWERAVTEIPLCCDLWIGLLGFMKEVAHVAPVAEDGYRKVNSLYDRAIDIAGMEFNSDRLWNDALMWHESRGNWQKVCEIYDRLIKTPTSQFKSHYDRYLTIINMYEPDILLSEDEYTDIFDRARENLDLGVDMMVTEEKVIEEKAEVDGVDVKPSVIIRKKHHPDVLSFFREELIERRTRWHEKTAIMLTSRLQFEEQIKRPYFDVKKMEVGQLKNWREYLDYEIEEGIEDRIETLFERCVIACALYDTMWLKYAQCYAAISLRKIGLSRRKASNDKNPDYSEMIQQWEALIHNPGTSRHLSSFYSIKLARFHLKCRKDRRLAEKVIRRALERDRDNIQLHLQLIDLAYTDPEFDQMKVIEAFNEAIGSRLDDADRLRLSQSKLDFLEDIGDDIEVFQEHTEQHQPLLHEVENPNTHTRKRKGHRDYNRDRDRDRGSRRDRDNNTAHYGGGGGQAVYYQPQAQVYDYNAGYAYQGQGYY